jgi:pantothenate kinase
LGESTPESPVDIEVLYTRIEELIKPGGRVLLGITGPPGSGKSTLAAALVQRASASARVLSQDAFHLAGSTIAQYYPTLHKGSIDTFDAHGFLHMLRRLRSDEEGVIYAPEFRREIEEPVAGAISIDNSVRLVVVEGNYLLDASSPWNEVHPLLDEVWYSAPPEKTRIKDLVSRHHRYGKSQTAARAWALGPDQENANRVALTKPLADKIVNVKR